MRRSSACSVLTPWLFNVALEEALRSQPLLLQMMKRGYLLAYADDILIRASSPLQIAQAIKELDNLQVEWGLSLNRKKCQILAPKGLKNELPSEIEGIKLASRVKYLGIKLHADLAETKVWIKNAIRRNLVLFKRKMRTTSIEVKDAMLGAYCRSFIIYYCTPMVAANMWTIKEINSIENEAYWELHLLPKDIPRALITNVTRMRDPSSVVVERIAKNINEKQASRVPSMSTSREGPLAVCPHKPSSQWTTENKSQCLYTFLHLSQNDMGRGSAIHLRELQSVSPLRQG